MILIKDLKYVIGAICCFIISYFIAPFGEQYQGATGYIYEYGWLFSMGFCLTIIIGLFLLTIVVVNNYEVRN